MAEQGAEGWIADLGREEGVSRLIRALALSDRFHVYLLLCETPRVAQAVFDLLPARVAEEREEPVRLVRLDPYEGSYGPGEPITFEHLADRVLERLVSPAAEERDANVIIVVDGSKALPQDDEAWAILFQRMNERRNVIAGALRGALVVCLPRRLEPVFAHAAPDFWSIRSLAVVVEGAPPPDARILAFKDNKPTTRYGEVEADEVEDSIAIEAGIAAARESLAKAPDDAVAFVALQIWLDRRVGYDFKRGALDQALHTAEESVALVRRRMEREPDHATWLLGLSANLDGIADIYKARKDLTAAYEAYEECVGLFRRVLKQKPDHPEWLRGLSVSLEKVGGMQEARGNLTAAYAAHVESLGIVRRLLEREPDRTQWLGDLAVSLESVGGVLRKRGDLTAAYEAYAENVDTLRSLLKRDPDRTGLLHDLMVSLGRIGDVQLDSGALTEAYEAYDESLMIARRLLEQDPTRYWFRANLAQALVRKAFAVMAMGRPADALRHSREALAVLESITQSDSPLPDWSEEAALVRKQVAHLEALLAPKPKRRRKKR